MFVLVQIQQWIHGSIRELGVGNLTLNRWPRMATDKTSSSLTSNWRCNGKNTSTPPAHGGVCCRYLIFFRSRLGRWLPAATGSASAAASSSPSTTAPSAAAAASSSSGFWPSSLNQQRPIPIHPLPFARAVRQLLASDRRADTMVNRHCSKYFQVVHLQRRWSLKVCLRCEWRHVLFERPLEGAHRHGPQHIDPEQRILRNHDEAHDCLQSNQSLRR